MVIYCNTGSGDSNISEHMQVIPLNTFIVTISGPILDVSFRFWPYKYTDTSDT